MQSIPITRFFKSLQLSINPAKGKCLIMSIILLTTICSHSFKKKKVTFLVVKIHLNPQVLYSTKIMSSIWSSFTRFSFIKRKKLQVL